MATRRSSTPGKLCFVTIGATASFDSLIKATLSLDFLDALRTSGYTDLLLQHGTEGGSILQDFLSSSGAILDKQCGINIKGFDFNKQGLGVEMRAAKGSDDEAEGVVISHAGTSSQSHVSKQPLLLIRDFRLRLNS